MSEAPKELWADWDYEATDGVCGVHTHKKYASGYEPECPPIRYVRADLVQAAEQRGYANAMEAERKLHEDHIKELEAKHTELVSAVKDLLHDVKYGLLDEGLSDGEGYELWEEVRKFRRVVCAAGLAELADLSSVSCANLKGQNDE